MTADAIGGVWTYALDLGQGLKTRGVRVTLAVTGPPPDAAQRANAAQAGLELALLDGALDWTAADEREVAASAARLRALSAELRPDLMHLNSPALAAFGAFPAPVLAACHSCAKTWWTAVQGDTPLPRDLAWRAALTDRGYARADALVAPSRAFAGDTRAAHALALAPHVVLNGREPNPDGSLPPARTSERRAVLTAGRLWDHGKDIPTLDRAAGRAAGLDIAAAGPATSPTGWSIPLRHLRPLGRLDEAELSWRLAARPVFVSTSLYEPFGLAVLEAALAGCPLVLADIATFRELWDGAARFFPPGDDATLAAELERLCADAERRAELGAAARTRARRYGRTAMTEGHLALYATLSPVFAGREVAA